MTPISDRTETESIERVFSVLLEVDVERRESFSRLEWAGIGALLHDFYSSYARNTRVPQEVLYCVLGHSLELDPKSVVPLVREAKATFEVLRGEIGATLPFSTKQAQWAAGSCQSETLVESTAACPHAVGGWGPPPLPQPPRAQHPDRRLSRDLAAGYGEPALPALRPAGNASPESLFPGHW